MTPLTPEQLVAAADVIVNSLLGLPAAVQQDELTKLMAENPTLHAVVRDKLTGIWPFNNSTEAVSVTFTVGPVRESRRPGVIGHQRHHRPVEEVLMALIITDSQQVPFAPVFRDKKGQPTVPSVPPTWSVSDQTIVNVTPSADGLTAVVTAVGVLTAPGATVQVQVQAGAVTGTSAISVIAGDAASVDMGAGTPVEQPPVAQAAKKTP